MYSLDRPFTGLIKEALRLCGIDVSAAVQPPAKAPDAAMRARLKALLEQAGVI
jgi:4-hydroxy-tetrahydrodipicolinate synthase